MNFPFHSQPALHLTWLGTSKLGLGIFSHARWYRSGTNRGMASSHRSFSFTWRISWWSYYLSYIRLLTTLKWIQLLFHFLTLQLVLSLLFLFSLLFVIIPIVLIRSTEYPNDQKQILHITIKIPLNLERYFYFSIFQLIIISVAFTLFICNFF